ncbi:hypothetical protein [Sphingobacterium litopenaei]|uniref:GLPGLI family protein n=1 Tax=Sphingobacterium litopenaei TaxID=2763500 RepID=A0ABR7YGB2_9SPHI|nr:hypothetical protein [Sphingobacterium litopenaei]MBD1430353.1 hypothetical protein [Sphingobacterium litopenaei]
MKRIFSLVLLFLFSLPSFSQYPTFKIDYKYLVDEAILQQNNKQVDESQLSFISAIIKSLAFQEEGKPLTQIWVNKHFVRAETSLFSNTYELNNKIDQLTFIVYPETKEYYKTDGLNDKLLDFGDSIKLASELPIKFVDGQEKKIAGYTCKLAKIIVNEDHTSTIHIWYTEDLPQVYWGEYAYLKNIPGAALEISTSGIGIQAYQIKPDGDVNLFKIPSDFSEIKALN